MATRPPIRVLVALALFVPAVVAMGWVASYLQKPYSQDAVILPSEESPEVLHYAGECAGALTIALQNNQGTPFSEPYIYLRDKDETSPDGRFTFVHRRLPNSYHQLVVERHADNQVETVLVLQESDPGSRRSHGATWTDDSHALFVYGSGTPAGHAHTRPLSLVYFVDQQALYAIDLSEALKPRLKNAGETR